MCTTMEQKKNSMIKSSIGSVFTIFSEQELAEWNEKPGNYVAVSGAVNEPAILEVKDNTTLRELIEAAGGMLQGKTFKAVQAGIPCGRFFVEEELDQVIDTDIFKEGVTKSVIVLSEDECIIQYAQFYLQYLIGKMEHEQIERYLAAKEEFYAMEKMIDQIAKGRATMRDIYLLRGLSEDCKQKANQEYSTIGQIITHFYDEIKEHIEDKHCRTLRCNHLTKLTITEKCIGCGACKRACPVDCVEGEVKKRHKIEHLKCTHC